MDQPCTEPLHLCMGSACHQLGVYHLLPVLQELLQKYQVESRLELKGAFCLGPCAHGVVLKFRDRLYTDLTRENLEETFVREILPILQTATEEKSE
jgi:NADH:ubiquinone oxidoreductase subunit E